MWSPIDGVSFRGVRSRSVRTPNFGELYEAKVETLTGAYIDACSLALYYASETRAANCKALGIDKSEEHTSELQSLMRTSYDVLCLKKKKPQHESRTIEI